MEFTTDFDLVNQQLIDLTECSNMADDGKFLFQPDILNLAFSTTEDGEDPAHTQFIDSVLDLSPGNVNGHLITYENDIEDITTLTAAEISQPFDLFAMAPPSYYSENEESTMYSPMGSASPSTSDYGSPASTMVSTITSPSCTEDTKDTETITVVSPEVLEQPTLKRKRGRRPKSEQGLYVPVPRAKKPRKPKIYEITQPFEDAEQERKRLNALNAKKHREFQKNVKNNLEKQLQDVKSERDSLKSEVEALQKREAELTKQLEIFKNHFSNQALSVVTLLETAEVSF